MIPYAIIGGTGMEALEDTCGSRIISTPYGDAKVYLVNASVAPDCSIRIAFLSRHGTKHNLAPHEINYRANLYALHSLGVRYILSTNAVGSCRNTYKPGSIAVVSDFIDFTKGRVSTFDLHHKQETHVSMDAPYSPYLSDLLEKSILERSMDYAGRVVYVCTEGPRFESAAEIRMFANWGADVVGMTGVPEVCLARELNMQYAAATIVTNYGTGVDAPFAAKDIDAAMKPLKVELMKTFISIFTAIHVSTIE